MRPSAAKSRTTSRPGRARLAPLKPSSSKTHSAGTAKSLTRVYSRRVEYLRSFGLFGLWQLWQSSGPGDQVYFMIAEKSSHVKVKRLEWFLLTTLRVESWQDAERVLNWYPLRWRIEDWHRVLKSGWKVEHLGHRTGERIERAVMINAMIAWRLMVMMLLGRETSDLE